MTEPEPKGKPKTQPSFSGGPPRPPKKTARGVEDNEPPEGSMEFREALAALAARDVRKAQLIRLIYLEGMTLREAAKALGVSESTAKRDWAYARAWLFRAMNKRGSKKRPVSQHDPPHGTISQQVLAKARELNISGVRVAPRSLDKITAAFLEECLEHKESVPSLPPSPPPPVTREMTVPSHMSVRELASVLGKQPFQIVADLMEIGVFATINQLLDFETISKVARKHGFNTTKAQ